ncbi:hypothetical protein [Ornithinimicrobium cavernae]|uniref:hypothetical protein n=1 Tax=Ornithinimicrobium cavernae TaxID=2666047 RepID=UPI000D692ACF|nr:hypothetical protein [Ornithinimicrobium cavernae]
MEFLVLNSSILSPRGFRPRVSGPREGQQVAPRRLWGTDDVAALREAPFVRVTPDGEPGERQVRPVLETVVALALAGVPVTGDGLPGPVRERLDPTLLEVMDRIGPDSVSDAGERELASLALRRRAWQVAGYRPPPTPVPPTVLVLLPDGDLPAYLLQDLAAQETTGLTVRRRAVSAEDEEEVLREERATGAVYVTRMDPGLRYGPHHLADLVHALAHSGARVALSPPRFLPWRHGAWLEDGSGATEAPAGSGLPGGSLWYAVDGATEPVAGEQGYAVHGANAVPAGEPDETAVTGPAPLRLHRSLPRVLAWLGADDSFPAAAPGPVAPSYFALPRSGDPVRARSSVTASDS